jgi:cytochrome c peroxidase
MHGITKIGIFASVLSAFLFSCSKELPPDPIETLSFVAPSHFPEPDYNFSNNPVTNDGFELGRRLFYDTRLSADYAVSCASCHKLEAAFSDVGKPLSQGVGGAFGDRNSPGLYNLAWHPAFMWDGGVNHIEISSFAAITHPRELNMDFAVLLNRLRAIPEYQLLFEKAFGSPGIDDQRFFYAMTQFTGLMISASSKYDEFLKDETTLTAQEMSGKALFEQHCTACHAGVLQTDFSYRNNGLDAEFSDPGRKLITNNPEDDGKFRVPSLRNVALTAPYMHDGRFSNLDQVLNHYSFGIQSSETLDPILAQNIGLNASERAAIIAFLHTLTDVKFTQDQRFSNPF